MVYCKKKLTANIPLFLFTISVFLTKFSKKSVKNVNGSVVDFIFEDRGLC